MTLSKQNNPGKQRISGTAQQQIDGVLQLLDMIDSGTVDFRITCNEVRERLLDGLTSGDQEAIRVNFALGWALTSAENFAQLPIGHEYKHGVFGAFADAVTTLKAMECTRPDDFEFERAMIAAFEHARPAVMVYGQSLMQARGGGA